MNEKVKPHFRIFVRNESGLWTKEFVERAGGAIYRAYLYDATLVVHCCEITPSYQLIPLYTTPFVSDDEGKIDEEIRLAEDDEVIYIHCHVLNLQPADNFYDCGAWEQEEDETYDQLVERVEEHYRCNVAIQFPKGF